MTNLLNEINCRFERDSTGLIGLKTLWVKSIGLCSPLQKTHWAGPLLLADKWSNESAVRGIAGIHACWPWTPLELLRMWKTNHCIVEVRGFGDTVQGDLGWRAERVILHAIHCFPSQLVDLCIGPDCDFDTSYYSEVPVIPDQCKLLKILISLLKDDDDYLLIRSFQATIKYAERNFK